MRMNKKGDIGFPEAMMSVMIVTIVLTLFLGTFVLVSNDKGTGTTFDDSIINDFSISGQELIFNGDIEDYVISNDYHGLSVLCSVPGDMITCDITLTYGELDGEIVSDRYLRTIGSDDGRSIPVVFEVAVCN